MIFACHISVTSVKRLLKDTTTTLTLDTDYFQLGTNTSDFIFKDLDLHSGQSLEIEYKAGCPAESHDAAAPAPPPAPISSCPKAKAPMESAQELSKVSPKLQN